MKFKSFRIQALDLQFTCRSIKLKPILLFISFSLFLVACGGNDDTDAPDQDPEPQPLSLDNCPVAVSNETFDILTWNIQQYPKSSITANIVEEVIEIYDVDVISLQEITSVTVFNSLVSKLQGWSGTITQVNGSNLMLGYLYKDSEVTVEGTPFNLFEGSTDENNNAFTAFRRPYLLKANHTNGLSINLINIHLKCCNGSQDRRRAASDLLKGYIDNNLANEEVLMLGDYNDDIIDTDNVFQVFLDDPQHYRFTTMPVAEGPSSGWSYPSFPSQIDNVLVTDELFDNEISTEVISLDHCVPNYFTSVSDHRPVLVRLRADQ
ncbi:endonuclease/exonuclease/phosphatase family protein [Roseivirga misakiensis]|uniref:Endonuclease/exonuclease/phosphatase domain-containing protein n=1 Tax=Roseivirga misakiensis TaxID=1563681 RepID=A0A1E5T186_9BACT|nr:endonuclease/exonuclease/phosphatase family protein [Roseivirga misakiensis]OEK05129.1 hypothetical protein BFP71_17075 [Roseivirga misakiensis]